MCAEADKGRTKSSTLDLGDDGVDHENLCFGWTCIHSRNLEAKITSMEGGGGEVVMGLIARGGGWATAGGDGAGSSVGLACRNDDERRLPRELSVKADLRLVEEVRWRVKVWGGGERP